MSIHSQDETSRTQPHRRVERILTRMQIGFDSEVSFKPYWADIYIPEWHIAVEVDGPGHSPGKDAKRDAVLMEKYKLPVLRIKSDAAVEEVIKAVEDFVLEWYGTADERKMFYRETL